MSDADRAASEPQPRPAHEAEPPLGRPALHRSVFARLVLIMLTMALCLMGLVIGFFRFVVDPTVGSSVNRVFGDSARRLAAESPGLPEARQLAARLDVQIRYQGPRGAWATDDAMPGFDAVSGGASWGHDRYVVASPDGGRYLFSWEFGRRTQVAHDRLLLMLLALMVVVFLVAHLVLRRALRPLSTLQDGVARLSAGDLDVVLPNRTRDEFGALTGAFNRMAARVKDMVRARDQLLQDVSHELRSPLTRLKVALALLPDSPKRKLAEADAAEMEELIGRLLELERLRDGGALHLAEADLVALSREAAKGWQGGPPGVCVVAERPEVAVRCDAEGLRTVLRNLLENAAKHSLPDSRPIEIRLATEGDAAVLRVTDNGMGLPEADLERLFEPFFRVDRSRSRRTGGYGLGLSICRRIVEAHGGTITAANSPGRGACFTVRLPGADSSAADRPRPARA